MTPGEDYSHFADYSDFRPLLTYPGTTLELEGSVIEYIYRKRIFWITFCMGKRKDMKIHIQRPRARARRFRYLAKFDSRLPSPG
jgi:hypothetical protein